MKHSLENSIKDYKGTIDFAWDKLDPSGISILASNLLEVRKNDATVFICGNSGSANLANDLRYGINPDAREI
jgi:phosphoheptose isomerase